MRGLALHKHRPWQLKRQPPHPALSPNGGEGFPLSKGPAYVMGSDGKIGFNSCPTLAN